MVANKKIVKTDKLINRLDKLMELMNEIENHAAVSFSYNKQQESVNMLKKIV
ncbi:hypothetical protein SAMN04487944_101309 [Gracilibacillus ureilyticus]|uniref:Uncharacterized protein n=1 Tax=Gracilibacillus ureilyticus TaxID=531814 RepID=A0A1H9LMD3_9BACI|nr:hypothetical protein [Gracilibacillus ureilyticus]SER12295.1 hypothetical protein SAMN04487944_101309 [Gracilibacillus ureilyticus]